MHPMGLAEGFPEAAEAEPEVAGDFDYAEF